MSKTQGCLSANFWLRFSVEPKKGFAELGVEADWVVRAPLLRFQTSDSLILVPTFQCVPLVDAYDRFCGAPSRQQR